MKIFYWVDHIKNYEGNSGIQRVTRMLARNFSKQFQLLPVKWNGMEIESISKNEADNISKFNGPNFTNFDLQLEKYNYLLIPELLSYFTKKNWKNFHKFVKKNNFKTFIILYDLIPVIDKHHYEKIYTKNHLRYLTNLFYFDGIYSISNYVKKNFEDFFYIKNFLNFRNINTKLFSVPISGEIHNLKKTIPFKQESFRKKFNLLSIISIEKRKNIEIFLKTINELNNETNNFYELKIVGKCLDKNYFTYIKKYIDQKNIIWLDQIDENKLRVLYEEAHAIIHPALNEGYGLPIVESQWFNRISICHNNGVFNEIANHLGETCLQVDMSNSQKIKQLLLSIKNNKENFINLNLKFDNSKLKTWRNYADEIGGLIKNAC